MTFKPLWDFMKPVLIKTLKYGITIALTSLGFSSLQSCYAPIKCENVVLTPKVSLNDSIAVSLFDTYECRDSVVHSYDDEAQRVLNDCTTFLKAISNKILK